jgi:Chaperone of endosialidase
LNQAATADHTSGAQIEIIRSISGIRGSKTLRSIRRVLDFGLDTASAFLRKHREISKRLNLSSRGSRLRQGYGGPREIREGQNNERKIKLMKNRSLAIFATMVLACFGVLPQMLAAPDVAPPPDGCYPGFTTAEGCNALTALAGGAGNTALGWYSLHAVTTGSYNTGVGAGTLVLTTGSSNTAVGTAALLLNTAGSNNTAVGTDALVYNTADRNTAVGANALLADTNGTDNCAVGFEALTSDTGGGANTAVGRGALDQNVSGNFNTAIGKDAGGLATGSGNVYIGHLVAGVAGENNHTYIRNINSTNVSGGGTDVVTVDLSTGLLGHLTSSRRYKEDIKPMNESSEVVYRLKPVTYRYKKDIDRTQSPAFGLIAEEVAQVSPNLVARNSQGQPESVHYEMVNAMLLNEFLKEHQTVQELKATVAQQKKQIDVLAAGLQKVSAQLEISKPAPQIVTNKP